MEVIRKNILGRIFFGRVFSAILPKRKTLDFLLFIILQLFWYKYFIGNFWTLNFLFDMEILRDYTFCFDQHVLKF